MVRADAGCAHLLDAAPAADALDAIRRRSAVRAFARALDDFLDDWGFRCSGELMLTVPSFQEDPAPLIDLLKAYAARGRRVAGRSPARAGGRAAARDARVAACCARAGSSGSCRSAPVARRRRHCLRWTQRVDPAARARAAEAGAALQPAAPRRARASAIGFVDDGRLERSRRRVLAHRRGARRCWHRAARCSRITCATLIAAAPRRRTRS